MTSNFGLGIDKLPELETGIFSLGHDNPVELVLPFKQLVREVIGQELHSTLCKQNSLVAEHFPPVVLAGKLECLPDGLQLLVPDALVPVNQQHLILDTTAEHPEVILVIQYAHIADSLHIQEVNQVADLGFGGAACEVKQGGYCRTGVLVVFDALLVQGQSARFRVLAVYCEGYVEELEVVEDSVVYFLHLGYLLLILYGEECYVPSQLISGQ